ncbi:MAG: flagellar basal body P-ring formation chaperone FlgA [Mangrovicoccus sp.]|nr:flagellar basal body P-ring formation chaperone FlgA [Mangrovicoccus sp.]
MWFGLKFAAALLSLWVPTGAAVAETVVATKTLRAETIIAPGDVRLSQDMVPGGVSTLEQAIGFETRRNIYLGQPLRPEDLSPPAVVERNQIVTLSYHRNGLAITTEGRALGRAGIGGRLRVLNLSSRSSVMGTVLPDGTVAVRGHQ